MKPNATIATGLIVALLAGPAGAQTTQAPPPQQPPPATQTPPPATPTPTPSPTPISQQSQESLQAENLDRIREAINREPALRIENGQLRIYVDVVGHWPSFSEYVKGYDLVNGPTGYGNPMSHAEFVAMSTPRDLYSTAGIQPAEILTMAAVNAVGHWALAKAINKWASSRKDKKLEAIRAQIDAELAALAAIKKDK